MEEQVIVIWKYALYNLYMNWPNVQENIQVIQLLATATIEFITNRTEDTKSQKEGSDKAVDHEGFSMDDAQHYTNFEYVSSPGIDKILQPQIKIVH